MRPNDETIYNGNAVENEENPQVENQIESEGKKAPWKMIGLGAATGILMGAGAIFATTAMAADGGESPDQDESTGHGSTPSATEGGDDSLHVAHPTTGTSFSQAFAEARAEVGPGGVFHWNGGIYSTYTKEEWNAMSADEKQEFAEAVKPEYSVDRVDTAHLTAEHPRVHVVPTPEPEPDPTVNVNIDEVHVHYHNDGSDDDDVHMVGYLGDEDVLIDGKQANVMDLNVDGHAARVIDYEDNDEHDIAMVDLNDNLVLDQGEAFDLNTGEVVDSDLLAQANVTPVDAQLPEADVTSLDAESDDNPLDVTFDI